MFKKKYSAKEIKLMIRNALLVVFGTMILACGTGVFLVQFDLVTGGMPGMAIILNSILVDSNGSPLLPIDVYIFILSWGLFFIGLFVLGKDFAIKTLISTLVYSPMFSISIRLVDPNVLGGYFYLAGSYEQVGIILSALFGGTCVGAGCAITFLGGGSTGVTDIIAFIICKFFKRLRSSIVIFTIDVLIVIGGVFVINDFVVSLLGVLSAFICALVIDKLFLGESKAFIAHIVSDKYEEINQAIIEKLDRTTTIIQAEGGYSRKSKKVVMVSFTMSQYATLTNLINIIDRQAFVSIHRAHEINGEGWSRPSPDPEKVNNENN